MANTVSKVFSLIEDTVRECGVTLWDVKFVKEGASHYLRIYIDSEDGIGIDDCSRVSHAIDPIIDSADPIDVSYYLEVCSPGLCRELTREEHFNYAVGKDVKIKLFKAFDGKKEIIGKLLSFDNQVAVIETDGSETSIAKSDIAKANLNDDI